MIPGWLIVLVAALGLALAAAPHAFDLTPKAARAVAVVAVVCAGLLGLVALLLAVTPR
jgi:hypothetical protein